MTLDVNSLEYPAYNRFPYPFFDTGIEVIGTTYTGNPWDLDDVSDDPFDVRGKLFIRPSPFGGYQCSILATDGDEKKAYAVGDELDVDPSTVRRATDD